MAQQQVSRKRIPVGYTVTPGEGHSYWAEGPGEWRGRFRGEQRVAILACIARAATVAKMQAARETAEIEAREGFQKRRAEWRAEVAQPTSDPRRALPLAVRFGISLAQVPLIQRFYGAA